jgi:UDPglucose 6-dehydrogenase
LKIAVFGTGYVGLVTGTCFADIGNDVFCVDIDKDKVSMLKNGEVPYYEQGLRDLLDRNLRTERLVFTDQAEKVIKDSEVIFICVGTPEGRRGEADLTQVYSAARTIGKNLNGYKVIVNKSTVPVGTASAVKKIIEKELEKRRKKIEFDVVSNPEFLKEGTAIKDFQVPDRIVVGTNSERAKKIMIDLHRPIARTDSPIIFMDIKSAELTKYANNAMLATRISFMNQLSHFCERIGADIKQVAKGIGTDRRIGSKFLHPGLGYGGSCLPKDVLALADMMESHGAGSHILRAVDQVNEIQKKSIVPKLKKIIPNLDNKKIAIWGLSFKPKTDDMREAPSIVIINQLSKEYADIQAYDPEANNNAKKMFANNEHIAIVNKPYDALKDAEALIIVTEWDEFRSPDFKLMKKLMRQPVIIDGRNVFDPKEMKELGFKYISVGR